MADKNGFTLTANIEIGDGQKKLNSINDAIKEITNTSRNMIKNLDMSKLDASSIKTYKSLAKLTSEITKVSDSLGSLKTQPTTTFLELKNTVDAWDKSIEETANSIKKIKDAIQENTLKLFDPATAEEDKKIAEEDIKWLNARLKAQEEAIDRQIELQQTPVLQMQNMMAQGLDKEIVDIDKYATLMLTAQEKLLKIQDIIDSISSKQAEQTKSKSQWVTIEHEDGTKVQVDLFSDEVKIIEQVNEKLSETPQIIADATEKARELVSVTEESIKPQGLPSDEEIAKPVRTIDTKAYRDYMNALKEFQDMSAKQHNTEMVATFGEQYNTLVAKIQKTNSEIDTLQNKLTLLRSSGADMESSLVTNLDKQVTKLLEDNDKLIEQATVLGRALGMVGASENTQGYGYQFTPIKLPQPQDVTPTTTALDKVTNSASTTNSAIRQVNRSGRNLIDTFGQLSGTIITRFISGLKRISIALKNATKHMFNFKKSSLGIGGTLKKGFKMFLMYGLGIRSVYRAWNKLRSAVKEGTNVLVKEDSLLNASLSEVTSALKTLKYTLAGAFEPVINIVAPILTKFINLLIDVANKIGMVIASLSGQGVYQKARRIQEDYAKSLDKTAGSAANASKQLAGFDKLNVLNSDKGGGGGADGLEDYYEEVEVASDLFEKIKSMFSFEGLYDLGKTIAESINGVFDNIQWNKIKSKALEIGQKISTLINGFVDNFHFDKLGSTIAEGFNTLFNFLYGFVTTLHWSKIGEGIGKAITSFFTDTDFVLLADTIAGAINGLGESIAGFLKETDFKLVGQRIGEFLDELLTGGADGKGGIDFKLLGENLYNAIIGLADIVVSFMTSVDWLEVGEKIRDCLEEIFDPEKKPNILEKVGELFWDCLQAVISLKKGLFKGHPIANAVVDILIGAFALSTIKTRLVGIGASLGLTIGGSVAGGVSTATTTSTALATVGTAATTIASHFCTILMGVIAGYHLGDWIATQLFGEQWTIANNIEMLGEYLFGDSSKWIATGEVREPLEEYLNSELQGIQSKLNISNADLGIDSMLTNEGSDFALQLEQILTAIGRYDVAITDTMALNNLFANELSYASDGVKNYVLALSEGYETLGASERLSLQANYGIQLVTDGLTTQELALEASASAYRDYAREQGMAETDAQRLYLQNEIAIQSFERQTRAIEASKSAVADYVKEQQNAIASESRQSQAIQATKDAVSEYAQRTTEGLNTVYNNAHNNVVDLGTVTSEQSQVIIDSVDSAKTEVIDLGTVTGEQSTVVIESVREISGGYSEAMGTMLQDNVDFKTNVALSLSELTSTASEQSDAMTGIFTGLHDTLKNVFNGIISGSESMGNGVSDGINEVTESLNTFSFDIPDWIPGFGGKSLNFNIPKLTKKISIPRLAQGGVIPANNEFLAVLGDQKQGTNIEAPLDTIKQAVAEVMMKMGGGSSDSGDIVINIDGDEVFRVVRDKNNEYKKSNGKSAFA